jgi:hypothetical protein
MEFVGGLIGISQDADSLALRPEIGWAILNKQKVAQIRDQEAADERAQREKERARREKERADKEKAQVVAPPADPLKPRDEQVFRFVCPFCGHVEEIDLSYPCKVCFACEKVSQIIHNS